MKRPQFFWWAVPLLCLAASALAADETPWDAIQARSSVRAEGYSGTRLLDDKGEVGALSLWTDGRWSLGSGQLQWKAYAMAQSRSGGAPRARVRELFWRQDLGPVQWRVGRLMPAWGRADGLNPTDNLSPRDFRLLTPELEDQRFGRNGIEASLPLGETAGRLSVFGFKGGATHAIPLRLPPGIALVSEPAPRQADWAVKWDRSGQRLDASLSYYRGQDLTPDLGVTGLASGVPALVQRTNRQQVFGADFSIAQRALVWRGEAAVAMPLSRKAGASDRKRRAIWLVAGPEWTGGVWTLGGQLVFHRVSGYSSPDQETNPLLREAAWAQATLSNQTAARQHGLTFRLAHRAWNDTLQSELSVLALWPQGTARVSSAPQGLWRGKVEYALDDHWSVKLGIDHPFGPTRSFFGQWIDNRLFYVQLRRSL
jgi:hypothetical protein